MDDRLDAPDDVAEWMGVIINDAGNIIEIDWETVYLEEAIQMELLPLTLSALMLAGNHLSGSLLLTALAPALQVLNCSNSFDRGEISLVCLPVGLKHPSISGNVLTGSVDFAHLPPELGDLNLSINRFSVPVSLTRLPRTFRGLFPFQNDFSGWTDFSQLPKSLRLLNVSETRFEGEAQQRFVN